MCAQLICTASFDVWGFDADSDVPPTQERGRKKENCGEAKRKKKVEGTEMHSENTTSLPERNTVTRLVISIADASDRKCEWASCIQHESQHCLRTVQQSYCTVGCGSVRVDCSGRNPLWICVGFKAFLLSQPNVKVRM